MPRCGVACHHGGVVPHTPAQRPADALDFGRFQWRPAQRMLLVDGCVAPLGARALDLFDALIRRRERMVTKDELLEAVWPGRVVEDANLHVQISSLRKVLGGDVIATIPGRGYRFVALLDRDASDAAAHASVTPPALSATAASAASGTLPPQPLPLIGREDDLGELLALVRNHALVTLAGAGGIGKTRLALAALHALAGHWPGGAVWVQAASVTPGERLVGAVAQALRVAVAADAGATALAAALADRALLLVIDNCEHLLDAAAHLARALASRAPGVHLLLTSQEALNTRDEVVLRLAPLALPPPASPADERFGAVALFVQRARAADSRFRLDPGNAVAVAQICRSLDGLPLALELAAARVRLLGVHGLRDRLDDRLHLLGGGPRHALARHQTLRGALEWSHALLEPAEQAVLRRLGVFVGGFTLELAQRVASDGVAVAAPLDEWAVVDALAALVDKSLVVAEGDAPVRYRLLETMRLFALERLAEHGETAALRARHAQAVAALYTQLDEQSYGDAGKLDPVRALTVGLPEVDNARAALVWALGEGDDVPLAIALAGMAAVMFSSAGAIRELLPVMQRLLPDLDRASPAAQVTLLWRLGTFGREASIALDELAAIKHEAVRRARASGMRRRLYYSLGTLGMTVAAQGGLAAAQAVAEEMRALEVTGIDSFVLPRLNVEIKALEMQGRLEEVIDKVHEQRILLLALPGNAQNVASAEANLCIHLNAMGRHDEAVAMAQALVARDTRPDVRAVGVFNLVLALVRLARSDEALTEARRHRATLERSNVLIHGAGSVVELVLARGRVAEAVRACAALSSSFARRGETAHPMERAALARVAQACDAAGVDAATRALWQREGEALDDRALLALALD